MNFFCEKHGKSMRDAHFSMLAKFITDASMQKRLICTDDIKKAIENGQLLANQNRLRDGNRVKDPKSMIYSAFFTFFRSIIHRNFILRHRASENNRLCLGIR